MTEPTPAPLTFAEFATINRERCESSDGFGHPLSGWSVSDWFLAAMGEFGEAANKAKKLNRVRDGIPGNSETPEELRAGLANEIADTVIYLDLLAQSQGFDLGAIIVSKFNRTSQKIGAPHRLLDRERTEPGLEVARLHQVLDNLYERRWGPGPLPGQTTVNLEHAEAIAAEYTRLAAIPVAKVPKP